MSSWRWGAIIGTRSRLKEQIEGKVIISFWSMLSVRYLTETSRWRFRRWRDLRVRTGRTVLI